jgi:processing peptidase subunit alpha
MAFASLHKRRTDRFVAAGTSARPDRAHAPALSSLTLPSFHPSPPQVATFAVFIDAGSMYEGDDEIGVCHFLEASSFQSSRSRSAEETLQYATRHGITSSAVFNREVLMYKCETLRGKAEEAVSLLADAVMHATHTDAEVAQARQVIAYQRMELMGQPQALVSEHAYTAAYGESTPLGRPEKCPENRIEAVSADTLRGFKAKYFTAPRVVLSAVGVDHEVAVRFAQRYFGDMRARGDAGALTGRPTSPYLGGDVRSSPDWSLIPHTVAASAAKTEFTHMMLAFPTVGWSHDDVVPVCVVDTLLGGGSSFSAGGPGKGMYSRLYQQVLMSFPWVESANAFSAQLYDCGLVGTYGAAPPEQAGDLASLLGSHLARLCHEPVKPIELVRARNQLASSVMMNLETRGLLCEDIGRQILSHGKRLDPRELVRRIQAVSSEDIIRVMRQALVQPPSLAAVGDVSALPEYDAFREFFARATARFANPPGSAPMHFKQASAGDK